MATEFTLPELGEGIKEGTLVKFLVKEGDAVEKGQNLLEFETDKAVLEVPASFSGAVGKLNAKEGSKIKVGELVLTYEQGAAASPEKADEAPAPAAEEKAEAPSTPAPAPESKQEEKSSTLAAVAEETKPAAPAANGAGAGVPDDYQPVPASPATRRFAREIGVDIQSVSGSGPGGRISESDVKNSARQVLSGGVAMPASASAPLPDFSQFGEVETEAFSNVRRATANQMARSWQAPHVTQFDKADITDLERLRKKYSALAEKQGGKLTVTAILIKVVVAALKKYPQFNSSLDLANEQLILKKYFHVGVAVDTERGLLVPVIRDADQKGVIEIAAELGGIAERARNKKTSLQEMSGGCFTVTNLGGIGGTNFTPIVNTPEVAILGVARGSFEPVWDNDEGEFEPRMMLPLSLSYDHRVIDGADGARFLRFIAEALEEPFLLSL